jgi:hypothetical protein
MNSEIIDYRPEHIEWIMKHYPRSRELYWCRTDSWEKWPNQWYEGGPAYTLVIDEKFIMCAGILIYNDGKGEAWMVLSELFYKYKKECFRAVRDKMEYIISRYKLNRVESFIMSDFPEAERWVIHLGFSNVTPPPFGPRIFDPTGESMYQYVRAMK